MGRKIGRFEDYFIILYTYCLRNYKYILLCIKYLFILMAFAALTAAS